jgi:surface glycoprotein (TIGR04207 family)
MKTNDSQSDERRDAAVSVLLSALMVLSVVALGGAAFAGSAVADTTTADVVVDADGNGDYTSVQNAIDNASSGDTILVNDSTYTESLTVSTSNLTIVGQSESDTVIDGGLKVDTAVDGLTIESLTMMGDRGSSRTFYAASTVTNLTIDSVTFNGTESVGFAVYGNDFAGDVTIVDSTFTGYTDSSQWGTVSVSTKTGLDDVTFSGNDVTANTAMVAIDGNEGASGSKIATLTVTDNTFSGTTAGSAAAAALAVTDAASSTIEGNSFSDNFAHLKHDNASTTTDALVSTNTFDRAASVDGVGVFSSIQDAVDAASDGDTVEVSAGTYDENVTVSTANVTLEGPNAGTPGDVNRGTEAVVEGAVSIAASNVTVDGFTIRSDSSGLISLGGAEYTVTNNVLNASSGVVAGYGKADAGLLANNTIVAGGTSDYGVRIGDATGVTVVDNTFVQEAVPESSTNTPQGLLLSSTVDSEVRNNTFHGVESGQAVLISNNAGNSSGVTVADNHVDGFANGVFLYENADEIKDVSVTGNDVTNVSDVGITAADTSGSDGFTGVNGADTATNQADALLSSNGVGVVTVDGQTVAADPVTVDDDGPSDYASIQHAVDTVPDGTTVAVHEGTYETFDVETSNVSIVSTAGADNTTLDIGTDRINVNADNVTVSGVSVVFENAGIYTGNDNVSVLNSSFELAEGAETTGYGVRFEGSSSDGVVDNSEFVGINNTVEGEYGNGVVVAAPDGHAITNNTFTNNSIGLNVGSKQAAEQLDVAGNSFTEHGSWAIALNHDASGSPQFDITRNHIASNEVGILVVQGGTITVSQNDIVDNGLAIQSLTSGTVDATANWWGTQSGPAADAVEGDVRTNPFLTVPQSEAADTSENLTEFAFTVEMDAGAHAFGVPGPVEGTVGSIFNEFNGTVYAYADGSWTQVTDADRELSALDALLVVPEDGETARATVEIAEGSGTAAPSSKDLDEGWNFVGAPQSGAIEPAYGAASADPARALNLYDAPTVGGTSQESDWTKYTFGTATQGPDVSSVSAYWVYAEEDGSVAANVPAGVTYEEFTKLTDEYASAN